MTDPDDKRTGSAEAGSPDEATLDPNTAVTADEPPAGAGGDIDIDPVAPFALIAEGPGDRIGSYELRQVQDRRAVPRLRRPRSPGPLLRRSAD